MGGVPGSPLPVGTVTFLLTDVEGSSRLWEHDAAAASAALDRRLQIISETTCEHHGVLPREQGEGDSSVSAFARASDAAACAIEIGQRLREECWPAEIEIKVRIALHTGEAEVRDGTYQGAALNRCSRIRDLGHGGQVLVSQATYEVLADGGRSDIQLRDQGVHKLKDLERPEHVWQLERVGEPRDFPPLRSDDRACDVPSRPLTSFVGRRAEMEELGRLVAGHRLVTLTGAGGSGKTRLALELAARVADEHADGVWWVDLAPLADPTLVASALAATLHVRESPVEPVVDTVVRYLSGREALIVLDNCEHLIEASAALAAALVAACPRATVIATSRELLGISGEVSYPVAPLSLPSSERIVESDAVRLFVDRAAAVRPNFTLNDATASPVAAICEHLDGIPLAIELAAARVRVLAVDEIAAGLTERFHLLTGGARTALPRQRTLEGSVDWSHDLLTADEQAVFRRLAVFAGSFSLDGAEAVCGGDDVDTHAVLDLLAGLVGKSLVQVVDDNTRQTRYRLLETMRDYARRKLNDASEAEEVRERHLAYYVRFAEQAESGLEGPDLSVWLGRIDAELDNIRSALDWTSRSRFPARGARLIALLTMYWFGRSALTVGASRLEATVDLALEDSADRAGALSVLCWLRYSQSDMVAAARFGDEAIAVSRRVGEPRTLGRALHWRGWVSYWGQADRVAAWDVWEEAASLLSETDPVVGPLNLAVLGWSYLETGQADRARACLSAGLRSARDAGAVHASCHCLMVFGYLELVEGNFAAAAERLDEALALAVEVGDYYAEIIVEMFSGLLNAFQGRYGEAIARCTRGLAVAAAHRSPNGEAFTRLALGLTWVREGRVVDAEREFDAAFNILGTAMPSIGALCRAGQAQAALLDGRGDDSQRHANEALDLAERAGMVFATISVLATQAALAQRDGNAHHAEDLLHAALAAAASARQWPGVADILEGLGGVVSVQSRSEEAARLFGAAAAQRDALGYPRSAVGELGYAADVAAVEAALGAAAFERSWADGAALDVDGAIAYAQRGRAQRKRASHGWASLTPTEEQVVTLVADGLTNPQIGERLFISKRTVQTHLAHVFAKLGVGTRAELAAKAVNRRHEGAAR